MQKKKFGDESGTTLRYHNETEKNATKRDLKEWRHYYASFASRFSAGPRLKVTYFFNFKWLHRRPRPTPDSSIVLDFYLFLGSKWHSRRKLLTPTFHYSILEEFVDPIVRQSRILVEKLAKNVNRAPFNVMKYTKLCALDIICGKPCLPRTIYEPFITNGHYFQWPPWVNI